MSEIVRTKFEKIRQYKPKNKYTTKGGRSFFLAFKTKKLELSSFQLLFAVFFYFAADLRFSRIPRDISQLVNR